MDKLFKKENIFKFIVGILGVTFCRFFIRIPNVQPLMAFLLPLAKFGGWTAGMSFGIVAIIIFDLLAGKLGIWTLVTAGSFALIGILSSFYLTSKKNNMKNYIVFSIVGTLIYDAITGLGMGTLVFNQSFTATFYGQIPFTLYHLAGNTISTAVLSPLIYRWLLVNPHLETGNILALLSTAK